MSRLRTAIVKDIIFPKINISIGMNAAVMKCLDAVIWIHDAFGCVMWLGKTSPFTDARKQI